MTEIGREVVNDTAAGIGVGTARRTITYVYKPGSSTPSGLFNYLFFPVPHAAADS